MIFSKRRLLLGLLLFMISFATAMLLMRRSGALATAVAAAGALAAVLVQLRPGVVRAEEEPEDICDLSEERRAELMRGTSKLLREMRYRYSVRMDATGSAGRPCFTALVNTVRLGFLPAFIIDNDTERQGYGYVAFVYDSDRWRGPGLPCPAGREEAMQHAARCVTPLEEGEDEGA